MDNFHSTVSIPQVTPFTHADEFVTRDVRMSVSEVMINEFAREVMEYVTSLGFQANTTVTDETVALAFRGLLYVRILQVRKAKPNPQAGAKYIRVPSVMFPILASIGEYESYVDSVRLVPAVEHEDLCGYLSEVANLARNGKFTDVLSGATGFSAHSSEDSETGVITYNCSPAKAHIISSDMYAVVHALCLRVTRLLAAWGLSFSEGLPKDLKIEDHVIFTLELSDDAIKGVARDIPNDMHLLVRAVMRYKAVSDLYGAPRTTYHFVHLLQRSLTEAVTRSMKHPASVKS